MTHNSPEEEKTRDFKQFLGLVMECLKDGIPIEKNDPIHKAAIMLFENHFKTSEPKVEGEENRIKDEANDGWYNKIMPFNQYQQLHNRILDKAIEASKNLWNTQPHLRHVDINAFVSELEKLKL